MSEAESFYWKKLTNKSFSFESEQFFYFCFILAVQRVALITPTIYHCCVVRQKEFSRKIEMSKVESFYWNTLSNKSFSFELEQFFYLFFLGCSWGAALITSSIYHYCVITQKEFSKEVEMSKVESFYWNTLSNKSSSFESAQFFLFVFCFSCLGGLH